jgi:hypothetical protein
VKSKQREIVQAKRRARMVSSKPGVESPARFLKYDTFSEDEKRKMFED